MAKSKSDAPAIVFDGQVIKVQTLADGGVRLTVDMPETAIPQAAMLMECKREGIALLFTAEATILPETLTGFDDETKKGAEGKTIRVGRVRP